MTAATRRLWLQTAMSAGLCSVLASPARAQDTPSLDALARAKRVRFGAAVSTGNLADPRFMALVARECGVVVAENEHKWPYVQPAPDRFTWERGDAIVAWCEAHGIITRGHNLLWNKPRWIPPYLNDYDFGATPAVEAERIVHEHVTAVAEHYRGRIHSWDVVNETVDENTGELRDTVLTRAFGSTSAPVEVAFRAARAALPDAQLVYNDYMDWRVASAQHRAGVLRLLEWFRAHDVPVDALGVQAHISLNNPANPDPGLELQEAEWRAFLDAVVAMDYKLLVTEFDVNDRRMPADILARDTAVASFAKAFLDQILSYPQLEQVLTWGMVDHRSWLQGFARRDDGVHLRPLPYDENYRSKPMREAIAAAFQDAPGR